MSDRAEEIAANLASVEERIRSACAQAGRARGDVHLIVVTKRFPVDDVRILQGLGVGDIGENKDQEAAPKVAELGADRRPVVHFVGQLQTNKAGRVAAYADHVHSVDRDRLVAALGRGADAAGRQVGVLIQVALEEGAEHRGGTAPADVPRLADQVAATPGLHLHGVMAVSPRAADPAASFARLARVAERLRSDHPGAAWISAGMSGDLEDAVAAGATHLRVGTAILGSRPPHG